VLAGLARAPASMNEIICDRKDGMCYRQFNSK
jgi:hypothetical protein